MFIDQIQSIVQDNISNEKFGVGELASALGLSSSQTLRKVKAATGKSVNQYIREFRLEEAAKLIKSTDDTIAEIAYKVGFKSPSYFNKAFSKYFGIAPGEYKNLPPTNSETETNEDPVLVVTKSKNRKKPILMAIAAVLICVIGYVVINNSNSKDNSLTNSIAVLPFKDLSPEDNQWFCDGVSDNILHSLAQMNDLTVTSFTSSSTFRDSEKQIPQIAEELGVSYVLEGSVVLFEGKIKVIAQLIDANDKHVWSKEYNDSFENVIAIQQNVAREVMQQLQFTLSKDEVNTLDKYPTKNMEAYNLHLEGRRPIKIRSREDLQKNIDYNKKAIALDSNFVDAYTEVATSMTLLGIDVVLDISDNYRYTNEAIIYVNYALEIDPNSARANAVKARLLLGNDSDQSKEYFEKAIALNPNDANAHHWYAFYILRTEAPDLKQALKHASIAIKLSPFSSEIALRYTWTLILNAKYDEAEAYLKDYAFLFQEREQSYLKAMGMTYKTKSWESAFSYLHAKLKSEPKNPFYHYYIAYLYEAVIYDKNKAIFYMKKASELDPKYLSMYITILVFNDFYKEADAIMQSEAFKKQSEYKKALIYFRYYYYKRDFNKAYDIINENPELISDYDQIVTYAQLGYTKKMDSINKICYLHGDHRFQIKAQVHAILKQPDSMYYYLNKAKYAFYGTPYFYINEKDFDPYRNDTRFKALLKEYYIPFIPPSTEE